MLEVKNIVTETKNAFDGPTKNWAQLRKELKDIQTETSQTEKQIEKRTGKIKGSFLM